jgi:hypothetical protein
MPGHPSSSNTKPGKFTGVHMLATSFAAIAGVAITAWQTLGPGAAPPLPVQVTVVQQPAAAAVVEETVATKTDVVQTAFDDLGQGAQFSAALKDGSEQRYHFTDMFDGKPETSLSIADPDTEVNVLVSFAGDTAQRVATIEYSPPPASTEQAATVLDVMVLPEAKIDMTGNAIQSFTLQTTPGKQTFTIPEPATGKALWLRVSGPSGATNLAVGDFKILK